jgi:hypothetical protein
MRTFQLSTKTKSRESTTAGNSSVSSNKKKSSKPSSLKQVLRQLRGPRSRCRASSTIDTETTESEEETSTPNVLEFLTHVCPEDLIPNILAFAGPQKTAALSKVNRVWRDMIAKDRTWRVLCEELYKVCFLNTIASSTYCQIPV